MRKTILTILVMSLLVFAAYGQWDVSTGLGTAASDTLDSYGHGIAVDGAGKIWYQTYYSNSSVLVDTGSGTADDAQNCRAIRVFNPDGTPASFSGFTSVTVGSTTDTLWNTGRGIAADPNGDIMIAHWKEYWRINHLTGEGMQHLYPEDSATVVEAAFTSDGELVVGFVTGGDGVSVYDTDLALLQKAVPNEGTVSYARDIEVAPDGSAIYYAGFTMGKGFLRYNSDSDIYGDFTSSVDTLAIGMAVESCAWNPYTGYLWAGNTGGAGWTDGAHYAFDPAGDFTTAVDSIVIPADSIANNSGSGPWGTVKPRGIAFSPDGQTAYLTFFNTWDSPAIVVFSADPTGTWEHTGTFISGYSMKANYPNPFNPSTRLDISMKEAGVADLRIYDLRGAEVAVLNSGHLSAGDHSFTFNGTNMAAGVYIAKFNVNGAMYTQNMTLIK